MRALFSCVIALVASVSLAHAGEPGFSALNVAGGSVAAPATTGPSAPYPAAPSSYYSSNPNSYYGPYNQDRKSVV